MSNNRLPAEATPIWDSDDFDQTVRDAIAVVEAGKRRRHLQVVAANERLLSVSRERKASRMDRLAVALLLALCAALGAVAFFASAPKAKADIDPVSVAYAARYSDAVCGTLDAYPSVSGLLGVMQAILEDGLTSFQAGEVVTLSVAEACPWHTPLLRRFIAIYHPTAVA